MFFHQRISLFSPIHSFVSITIHIFRHTHTQANLIIFWSLNSLCCWKHIVTKEKERKMYARYVYLHDDRIGIEFFHFWLFLFANNLIMKFYDILFESNVHYTHTHTQTHTHGTHTCFNRILYVFQCLWVIIHFLFCYSYSATMMIMMIIMIMENEYRSDHNDSIQSFSHYILHNNND